MSNLVKRIVSSIDPDRLRHPVSDVGVYAFFTVVKSWRCGMSMTLREHEPQHSHQPVRNMGKIEKLPLAELLTWIDSDQPIERSVGTAALNSCLPFEGLSFHEGNALDFAAKIAKGKKAAVIGHFPHLEKLRESASSMKILEKKPQPGDYPAEAAPQILPESDVVAITGVTCLNDTIEGLLALKKPGSIFILLGPTVPIHAALFEAGIDVIAGSWIEDESRAVPMLKHGATIRVTDGVRYSLAARDNRLLAGLRKIEPPPERA